MSQIDCQHHPFTLTLDNYTQIHTKAIVIASEVRYRKLIFEHPFDNTSVYYATVVPLRKGQRKKPNSESLTWPAF